MSPSQQNQADARLESALEQRRLRDPREPLRSAMRGLKDTPAFGTLVRHYEEVLVPAVASGETDPITAWEQFGRRVAAAVGAGREVAVDRVGRAIAAGPEAPDDSVILFLPRDAAQAAVPLRIPIDLSPSQEATLALLVEGRVRG